MKNKPAKPQLPKTLFQYRPPELWALENLSQRVIHFTSPEKFNDPYDCNILPMLNRLTGGEFARLAKIWTDVRKERGVVCLSERKDNLLMWSHYAGQGKGFCLEFAIRDIEGAADFENNEVMPVNYNPLNADIGAWESSDDAWHKFFLHKSKVWAYEKEWRMVRRGEGKKKYNAEWLKAIYFGTEATEGTVDVVRAIVKDAYPNVNVKFYKGKPSKTKYKVLFKRMP